MNRIERVKNLFARKPIDYLPNHIDFSDFSRHEAIAKELGLVGGTRGLADFLDNHFRLSFSKVDMPMFLRNEGFRDVIDALEREGYAGADWENEVLYDRWGMGVKMNCDSFVVCFHPLAGDLEKNKRAEKFLPPNFNREILYMDIEDAIRAYEPPDFTRPGIYDPIMQDIAQYGGDTVIWPCGNYGIYERTYALLGFEQLMTMIALEPLLIEELIEKITCAKVVDAKEKSKLGLIYGHYADDLGTQNSLLFSPEMFRKLFKPRYKRIFEQFKSAGMTVGMHSCGNITPVLPDLIEIGLDVLEPVQPCMDLNYLKKEFGKDLIFWGGIDTQDLLPFGTVEQVREGTRKVIRILGKDDGYIIAPSQEIMKDVPLANVAAMLDVIRQERELHGTW